MDLHLVGNTIASGQQQRSLIGCRRGRGLGVVDEGVDGVEFVLFWPLWQWRLCFRESVERESENAFV